MVYLFRDLRSWLGSINLDPSSTPLSLISWFDPNANRWGRIWTLLYSLSFRLRTPSLARLMLCPVALHTIPFSRPPLYEAIGYCELGLESGLGLGNHASHTCSPSESVVSFSVTPIQGDILHPKYAWTAFPRLVCAEGYNVTWKIKQRG